MEYTTIGKTGIRVSRIVHGCMELGGSANPNVYWDVRDADYNTELLRIAFSQGITTFDTAESYGNGRSEEIVGRALHDIRNQCVLATKVAKTNLHADDIERSLENSLRRLQTDYIDLYYVHWPNPDVPLKETMEKLEQLRGQGVIRSIGVSNFSAEQLKESLQFAQVDAYQPEYNLLSRSIESEIIPLCQKHQISVFSYNSLSKGILTGAFHLYGAVLRPEDFRNQKPLFQKDNLEIQRELILCLESLAKKKQATAAQVAIRWAMEQPGMSCAIIGTQDSRHFLENIRAFSISLTQEEIDRLRTVSDRVIARMRL